MGIMEACEKKEKKKKNKQTNKKEKRKRKQVRKEKKEKKERGWTKVSLEIQAILSPRILRKEPRVQA